MLLVAGLLLAARLFLRRLDLHHPSVEAILTATGVGRTRAYQLRDRILEVLPELQRAPGRPCTVSSIATEVIETPAEQVIDFIMAHPGCVVAGSQRRHYDDCFRQFVVELRERHSALELAAFAQATRVPAGTLEQWLRAGREPPSARSSDAPAEREEIVTSTRIQSVIEAWKAWRGPFIAFCDHVSKHLRIPYGRTWIGSILELAGVRTRQRRAGRSPDEKALRGLFETFFPGAQWVGDGSPINTELTIGGDLHRFTFNLELLTDPASGAFVGASIRNEEDSAAVTEAFTDGVATTGKQPLALLLDNRPSNHTEDVDETLGETIRMRATRGRAQNKAHAEGGFGLFKSTAPPVEISADTPRDLAAAVLELIVTTWARTLNHRPRKNRGGASRVELYKRHKPAPEQVEQAAEALEQRRRKQEKAFETLRARRDPVACELLDQAFERLGLLDPESNIRSAIARYPLDAIIAGIAIYEAKHDAKTLPDGVDARYLLGIARNVGQQDEGLRFSELLLARRLEARDLALTLLESERDAVLQDETANPRDRVRALLDNAFATDRHIDRIFWIEATANVVANHAASESERHDLFSFATRLIHATYRIPYKDRLSFTRRLVQQTVPIDSPSP
ncbi:MAG: hypothetical protein JRH20_25560 [Deltaproteobacteria bacterium]|nr:hypothetical protein [Deltaproteobacteria bacterium]